MEVVGSFEDSLVGADGRLKHNGARILNDA